MTTPSPTPLFPALERFSERTGLLANARGALSARLPRILGQGRTRAEGLDLPPAPIERQQELLAVALPDEALRDSGVQTEIEHARQAVDAHAAQMRNSDARRRFAMQALSRLDEMPTGFKDNHYFAGRLVLGYDKEGQEWAWSLTPHYPVISKIPADLEYVLAAHAASELIVKRWTLPTERFIDRLALSWLMARHSSDGDNVLIADVARCFKIAVQNDRFWSAPAKRNFEDVPEAVFVANLIQWRLHRDVPTKHGRFELVPATLSQAFGPKSRAYYVPDNPEGTAVRPMIHIRRIPS